MPLSPRTIVVGGYIVGYPLGGMTWHHLNYLLGLHELGHEVWFLEDSGDYFIPYNPAKGVCEIDPTYGIDYLKRTLDEYGLPRRWCYYSRFWDTHFGLTKSELDDVLRRADLFMCVSGITPMREDRPRPRRTLVIDTDPVFTQLKMRSDPALIDYYTSFDAAATFGRLIGTPACELPTHGIDWIPTNQPIALRHWPVIPTTSKAFTTIGKWEHSTERNLEFNGRHFRSSKGVEWMKMLDLPARLPDWEMALGMQGLPADIEARFTNAGWKVVNPEAASRSPRAYQDFIQASAGEFTVAKEIYTGLPSGWFSDRAACYLASGRPVVTQVSGFERWLPTGEGLFGFSGIDDATAAIKAVTSDYARHATGARRVAEQHFDARRVLGELIERVMQVA